jgi:hypothetical protein
MAAYRCRFCRLTLCDKRRVIVKVGKVDHDGLPRNSVQAFQAPLAPLRWETVLSEISHLSVQYPSAKVGGGSDGLGDVEFVERLKKIHATTAVPLCGDCRAAKYD